MTVPVYSSRFGFQKNTTAWTSSSVPAGHVWVVRDISGLYDGLLGTDVVFALGNVGFFSAQFVATVNGPFHWEGRVVMLEGDHLDTSGGPDGIDFVISGYDLTLP